MVDRISLLAPTAPAPVEEGGPRWEIERDALFVAQVASPGDSHPSRVDSLGHRIARSGELGVIRRSHAGQGGIKRGKGLRGGRGSPTVPPVDHGCRRSFFASFRAFRASDALAPRLAWRASSPVQVKRWTVCLLDNSRVESTRQTRRVDLIVG